MGININSKILLSVASIAAAAALIVGATIAFFSDTETSTGNTFAAGELDLQIDAEAHYAGLTCTDGFWVEDVSDESTRPDLIGEPCEGTWSLQDLGEGDTFFALSDVKPGDTGESTISIHVFDNDAWGWFRVDPTENAENDCTEPEDNLSDDGCNTSLDGELQEALLFNVWLDQGDIAGFQCDLTPCGDDVTEGDNLLNGQFDLPLGSPGPIDDPNEDYPLAPIVTVARSAAGTCGTDDSDGDGVSEAGNGSCQGLSADGHLVGSTTYYFGVSWELPEGTGNEVQSDSFVADMEFQVEQYRNNPSPGPFPL